MSLRSKLLNVPRLQACLKQDSSHVKFGDMGDHVGRIQRALLLLEEDAEIEPGELAGQRYGSSTAEAVLTYKRKRRIINFSYQTQVDNIVGKMTIASLDQEMLELERSRRVTVVSIRCNFDQERVTTEPAAVAARAGVHGNRKIG